MASVKWEDIPREVYDDMVSALLSNLYPKAQRIDGSGGDGGRDVQIREPPRLGIFQLKSFTGRMTKGRRRQVKRSLDRAKALKVELGGVTPPRPPPASPLLAPGPLSLASDA